MSDGNENEQQDGRVLETEPTEHVTETSGDEEEEEEQIEDADNPGQDDPDETTEGANDQGGHTGAGAGSE